MHLKNSFWCQDMLGVIKGNQTSNQSELGIEEP